MCRTDVTDDGEYDQDERVYRTAHYFNLGLGWST